MPRLEQKLLNHLKLALMASHYMRLIQHLAWTQRIKRLSLRLCQVRLLATFLAFIMRHLEQKLHKDLLLTRV